MAEHYVGDAVVLVYSATDISGYARSVDITETAPKPDAADTTHKGDTAKSDIQLLGGAPETDLSMTVLDIYDALTEYGTLALNAKDTVTIYPNGVTHTYPKLTCNNAQLNERSQTIPFEGAVEISLAFNARNTLTRGTYDSTP
jgi:hypothetical protein